VWESKYSANTGKIRPVETIPGMGGEGINKGEWWRE
jgi:hypothetical protein